ncbi:MAG: hypothetical protein IPL78_09740 [Chloroflexi bacterium]|nr:hypothetical protein [Chloroflexota bacterium]
MSLFGEPKWERTWKINIAGENGSDKAGVSREMDESWSQLLASEQAIDTCYSPKKM